MTRVSSRLRSFPRRAPLILSALVGVAPQVADASASVDSSEAATPAQGVDIASPRADSPAPTSPSEGITDTPAAPIAPEVGDDVSAPVQEVPDADELVDEDDGSVEPVDEDDDPVEDEDDDGDEFDDPPDAGGDDGDFSFEIVDLTEDEEALKEELKVETKKVKGKAGTVSGTVKDAVSGDPLIGAYVEVLGTAYQTKTDFDGNFTLEVPVGTHEIRIRADANQPRVFSNVVIEEGATQQINVDLERLEGAGQTVVVEAEMNKESAGARMLERKESSSAQDVMSRDDITKSGGGSTASVARGIVGVTLVGGRFIFVRGLGHRYVNTLFDGARVPSPEPELRTVPLDIFPSGALSAINVQKTFTPDVPADFAGGSVQLESREVPDEFIAEISAEIGGDTSTTFRPMVTSAGYPAADAFGFGNIPRGVPDSIPRDNPVVGQDPNGNPYSTPEQLREYGKALDTRTEVKHGAIAPPNWGLKATIGYGFKPYTGGKLGFIVAAGYKAEHSTIRYDDFKQFGIADGELSPTPQVDYKGTETVFTVKWAGVGLLKYDINDSHRLSALAFYSRESSDGTRELQGRATVVGPDPVYYSRLRYVSRSILLTRLGGRHEFPGAAKAKVDWFASYAQARRDDPSLRQMLFTDQNSAGVWRFAPSDGSSGTHVFLDLVDNTESGALNVTLPFKQWKGLDGKFKAGAWIEGKQRQYEARNLRFIRRDQTTPPLPTGTGNIINDDTIDAGSISLTETTSLSNSYLANQEVYAAYGMIDLPFTRWFRTVLGTRFEASNIQTSGYDIFGLEQNEDQLAQYESRLEDRDWLPVLSFIFSPTENMNVRLGGTRTLARPEFRELSRFTFVDFIGGAGVSGNPNLVSTKVWNVDLRWEWFPSAREVVSATVFYKHFDEPIERVASFGSGSQLITFKNADAANNIGAEIEVRKNLEFIWKKLEDLSFGANLTYVFSRVDLGPSCDPGDMSPECFDLSASGSRDQSTTRVRPLQDQSPYVVNLYLSYDNDDIGTSGRIIYNVEGRRIAQVGALGTPDTYFETRHLLHFVFQQRLYKELRLTFKAENLINSPMVWTQNDTNVLRYREGISFELGLGYKF